MRQFLLIIIIFFHSLFVYAENTCKSELAGYQIVPNTHFPFTVNGKKVCFFAYYMTNPHPESDDNSRGNSIWFGYYEQKKATKIHKFPEPLDTHLSERVCTVDAVSFQDMNGDKIPDVTVIASCSHKASHWTIPLVFLWREGEYIFNDHIYHSLSYVRDLTVAEVHKYIKYSEYVDFLVRTT